MKGMDPSRKQAKEREFFDVHPGVSQGKGVRAWWVRFLRRRKQTVDLHPGRFRRYRRFAPLIVGATALVAALVAVRLFTKAEVQDFSPSLCLGTWENAAGASGAPENFDPSLAAEGFTHENSAIYRLPESEIFCGAFLAKSDEGEEAKGDITNVALTFIWRVGELPEAEPVGVVKTPPTVPEEPPAEDVASEDAARSDENGAPASEITPPAPPVEPPAPEPSGEAAPVMPEATPPAPTPEPAPPVPPESGAPSARSSPNFFSFIFSRAFAQEEAVIEQGDEPAPPAPAPVAAPPTEDIPQGQPGEPLPQEAEPIVLPPVTVPLEPTVSTDGVDEETKESAPGAGVFTPPPPPQPDENFLKVSYSVDGEAWFEIGKVNMANWHNFTARLPVSRWDELQRLQIAIEGIPTLLVPVPPVYLAGMFIEVNYTPPSLFDNEAEVVEESTEGLPVFAVRNAIKILPGRDESNVFGAGERVEFDLDLGELPDVASTSVSSSPALDETTLTSTEPEEIDSPPEPVPAPPPVEEPREPIPLPEPVADAPAVNGTSSVEEASQSEPIFSDVSASTSSSPTTTEPVPETASAP